MCASVALKLTPTERLILLAYADFANDTGICWPSHNSIARMTRSNRRTIQRTLRDLEIRGMVVVVGDGGKTNRVCLNLGFRAEADDLEATGGGKSPPPEASTGGGDSPPPANEGRSTDRGGAVQLDRPRGGVQTARSINNHQDPCAALAALPALEARELDELAQDVGAPRGAAEGDDLLRRRLRNQLIAELRRRALDLAGELTVHGEAVRPLPSTDVDQAIEWLRTANGDELEQFAGVVRARRERGEPDLDFKRRLIVTVAASRWRATG